MLEKIRAYFRCDGCNVPFSIMIDPAWNYPEGWSAFDAAVDAVRGSVRYEGPVRGSSSVQDDKHLCAACTRITDKQHPEDER